MRGIGTIAGVAATSILCGGYMLGSSMARDANFQTATTPPDATLGLAPLSLGNPFAASGPETSPPAQPSSGKTRQSGRPIPVIEQTFKVRGGDTLVTVLERAGVKRREANAAVRAFTKQHDPRQIRIGHELRVRYRLANLETTPGGVAPGIFEGFRYSPSYDRDIYVSQVKDNAFSAKTVNRPVTRHVSRSEAVIESSFYVAGQKAGLPPAALAELIRAFSWDVDFQRDIRKGDKFEVMFNFVLNDKGKVVRSNEILFAALTLRGRRKAIYRFDDGDGGFEYFDEKGKSAKKALMRTPIDGARLSSGFGRRRHPVLGYTKMHRGVDFAAPKGTPIYAAGSGVVERARRHGGYGKYVRLRHNGTYQTAYAHMSRYGPGIREGKRVRQGQVIGYVGTTGRSTGNHLHYEILRNGRQFNPMLMTMPSGHKLSGKKMTRYRALRKKLDTRYASLPKGRAIEVSSSN